ncbi:hypothetical protein [Micromonospora sp. URMC 103]|uniref:hypothetical protein n=1 Tax=Micromonospora sp. URMC 103 TaxID=3423406 RepID=UPI003F1BE5D5
MTWRRIGMVGARSVFGLAPERETGGGGRVLTGLGVFLFVGLPLVVVGIVALA